MPLSKYYGGHGEEVAQKMQQRYGRRWKEVFYATANAHKGMPRKKVRKRARKRVRRR